MKIAKERVIFDNYGDGGYTDEDIKEILMANDYEEDEITDDMIYQERYCQQEFDWEDTMKDLKKFFVDKEVEISGSVGVWTGVHKIQAERGEFWNLFNRAALDCDYWKLWDENGHFYLTCSHHDGTHSFEFKVVVKDKGTRLPRFAETVYGCPKREYEPLTKEGVTRKINNMAKTFY